MVVRRILAGALLAPLLVLSACGGDHTSVADPPVSPTSPSASATDPPHRESAKAFIRRWFDAGTEMQNSGHTTAYRALQLGCSDCKAVADRVDKAYAAGGYYKTRGVRSLKFVARTGPKSMPTLEVQVDLAATTFVERKGAPTQHFTGGPAHFEVGLKASRQSWLVTSFVQVAS
jgi:hypothetical protein